MARSFAGLQQAVVLDLETTGFSPSNDRMVSLAMLRADFPRCRGGAEIPTEEFCLDLINPERDIPYSATRVHGICDDHVAGADSFAAHAAAAHAFIGALPVVAHNVSFDLPFLNAEFARAGLPPLEGRGYCTMRRFSAIRGGKWPKLEEAARWLGLPVRAGAYHGAREDAEIALRVARALYLHDAGIAAL